MAMVTLEWYPQVGTIIFYLVLEPCGNFILLIRSKYLEARSPTVVCMKICGGWSVSIGNGLYATSGATASPLFAAHAGQHDGAVGWGRRGSN